MADSLEQGLLQFRQASKPFLALAQLDGVIDKMLGFVQREKELKSGIESLEARKIELETAVVKLEGDAATKQKKLASDLQAAQKDAEDKIAALDSRRATIEADTNAKVNAAKQVADEAVAKKAALEKDYDTAVTTMKIKFKAQQEAAKREMNDEINKLKAIHDELVNELRSLKGRIAAA